MFIFFKVSESFSFLIICFEFVVDMSWQNSMYSNDTVFFLNFTPITKPATINNNNNDNNNKTLHLYIQF